MDNKQSLKERVPSVGAAWMERFYKLKHAVDAAAKTRDQLALGFDKHDPIYVAANNKWEQERAKFIEWLNRDQPVVRG